MPPSKQEWVNFSGQGTAERMYPDPLMALGALRTAAVSFEHLTNDDQWDRFLSFAQARLDDAKQSEREWLLKCGNALDSSSSHNAQVQYQYYKGQVEALEGVMLLPSKVMNEYKHVKQS